MKNFVLFSISLLMVLSFSSCNKYDEGPFFSFKSAEKRLQGEFILDKYYINDVEIVLSEIGISDYRVEYFIDGTGKYYTTINDYATITDFEWELDDKKENIRERIKGLNDEWSNWGSYKKILKLTKDEFWIIDNNSVESTKFQFIKQ